MCHYQRSRDGSIDMTKATCCACGVTFATKGTGSGHDCPFGTWVNE